MSNESDYKYSNQPPQNDLVQVEEDNKSTNMDLNTLNLSAL